MKYHGKKNILSKLTCKVCYFFKNNFIFKSIFNIIIICRKFGKYRKLLQDKTKSTIKSTFFFFGKIYFLKVINI